MQANDSQLDNMSKQTVHANETLSKEKQIRLHDEGLKRIRTVLDKYGILILIIRKWETPTFVPDFQISLGCRRKDTAFIEYVASKISLNRDIGGMTTLRASRQIQKIKEAGMAHPIHEEVRYYVLVVNDEVWFSYFRGYASNFEPIKDQVWAFHYIHEYAKKFEPITVIPLSDFEHWLKDSIRKCANNILREISKEKNRI